MKGLLEKAVVFCAVSTALGVAAPAGGQTSYTPHPAVVRVTVVERGATSYGSGALVAADDTLGLVVTNWHVVRDAAGPITVQFPGGFRSTANVLAVDRDGDLAALAIRRPNVPPIALAGNVPRKGETLTIAGYGSGNYRAATGRRTPFVSPDSNLVEVSTPARQGDSGGPILNERGELAGVLFGTGFDGTIGSHCGRVKRFLDGMAGDFRRFSSHSAEMFARQTQETNPPAYSPPEGGSPRESVAVATIRGGPRRLPETATAQPPGPSSSSSWNIAAESPVPRPYSAPAEPAPVTAHIASAPPPGSPDVASAPQRDWSRSWEATYPKTPWADASPVEPTPASATAGPAGPTRSDQIKTVLAAIGILAILFHGLRLLGSVA